MNINENAISSESQNRRIADWLLAGHSITAMEALNMFGCFRLASRITDLKQRYGMDIKTDRITTSTGKRVACYSINTESVA